MSRHASRLRPGAAKRPGRLSSAARHCGGSRPDLRGGSPRISPNSPNRAWIREADRAGSSLGLAVGPQMVVRYRVGWRQGRAGRVTLGAPDSRVPARPPSLVCPRTRKGPRVEHRRPAFGIPARSPLRGVRTGPARQVRRGRTGAARRTRAGRGPPGDRAPAADLHAAGRRKQSGLPVQGSGPGQEPVRFTPAPRGGTHPARILHRTPRGDRESG